MYLYQTTILKDPTSFKKANDDNQLDNSEITAHENALADFEGNYKGQAILVEGVEISDTTFIIGKTYSDFSALIVDPLVWADVKYTENDSGYSLQIIRETML